MKDRIILDLCGGTGSWSKPYREAGYDVRLVTLPGHDVRTYQPPRNVYGILAAPPCTMFSLARTTAKAPRDLRVGMETVEACMRIVWRCREMEKLCFWALENPVGILRQFLGKPALTFHPCDYGDPVLKRTDIWGYFNVPRMIPVKLTEAEVVVCKTNAGKVFSGDGMTRQERRAITPQGFANAFFKANP